MGSGIPESIGLSRTNKPVFLFCGDGSFPFNVQELQTADFNFPVFITVFSNRVYLSIRSTQTQFLDGNLVGSAPNDVHLINIKKVANAFGIYYKKVDTVLEYQI